MKMKFTVAATLLSGVLALGAFSAPANAKVNFDIYFGVPHYGYQLDDDYVLRRGYGWYLPRDRYYNRGDRLTCNEARRIVRNNGYRNVSARECQGRTYTFRATRNGRNVQVYVNARTGGIWRG